MTKRNLLLPLAIFLAISVMGVSYAYWTDTLKVNTEVQLGTFEGYWSLPSTRPYEDGDYKDLVDYEIKTYLNDDYKLTVDIYGAHPGYKLCFDLGIHWTGSVPCHLTDESPIITVDPNDGSVVVTMTPWPQMTPIEEFQLHHKGEYFWELCVEIIEDDYAGIDPVQGEIYSFTVELVVVQFNDPSQT